MNFLRAFEDIDRDFSGVITRDELVEYMKRKNYVDSFVDKWLTVFDHKNEGQITVEDYCDTLGLIPRQEYIEQVAIKKLECAAPVSEKTDDYIIITIDPEFSDDILQTIVRLAREGQDTFEQEKDIAHYVKENLDKLYHPVWQLVVGRFQFGSLISHEPGYMVHLRVKRFAFLAWRVPEL